MDALEIALRLGVAASAGLAVGLEREITGHPAGVRTHVLVALGAAMFSLAGAYGFTDVSRGPTVDPARIAAQVASGIGFIGAGAIIRDRGSIKGLTTAATVWLVASCGVAAAAGAYAEVAIGTGCVMVTLVVLRLIRPSRWRGSELIQLEVDYARGNGTLAPILEAVKSTGSQVAGIDVEDSEDDSTRHLSLSLSIPSKLGTVGVVSALAEVAEIQRVRVSDEDG